MYVSLHHVHSSKLLRPSLSRAQNSTHAEFQSKVMSVLCSQGEYLEKATVLRPEVCMCTSSHHPFFNKNESVDL